MRKLKLKMSVSVDGFVGGPDGEIDWVLNTTDDAAAKWVVDTIWDAGIHIMGSKTFYDMAAWWPYSNEVFAAPMNDIPKGIFTRYNLVPIEERKTTQAIKDSARVRAIDKTKSDKLESWNHPRIFNGDLAEEIIKLKHEEGKPILAHGGAGFARNLTATGLIDEFHLLIHPVILGQGLPIFSDLPSRLQLRLESSVRFPSGTVASVYNNVNIKLYEKIYA